MAQQFYTILTNTGKAKLANANVFGRKINLTTLVVGDSNGNYYNPTEDQEKLVNEVWRGNIQLISVDEKNPNWIKIETVIPSDVGGFTIREVGALDDEGNLILIAKYPETYKPVIDDGATKELKIRTILEVSNAENVTLKIKSNLITATMEDIDNLNKKINNLDGKAVRLRNHIILDADTTKIPIGISEFNINDDIEVFINGRFLSKNINYKIAESNTEIENIDSNILWQTGDEIDICVNKNIKNEVNAKDHIDVGLIPEGSITENKLNPQFVNKVTKIQEAIQELFTNADNAQKGISNVIGSPLSASDTLTTQKDKIQTLKNTFASNLTSKGQSASGSESLNSLINKVGNVNIGKKFAKGSVKLSSLKHGINVLNIDCLNFSPTIVTMLGVYSNAGSDAVIGILSDDMEMKGGGVATVKWKLLSNTDAYSSLNSYGAWHKSLNETATWGQIKDKGFVINIPIPSYATEYTIELSWFAIE